MTELGSSRRVFSRAGFAALVFLAAAAVLPQLAAALFALDINNGWIQYALSALAQYGVGMTLAALLLIRLPSRPIAKKKLGPGRFMIVLMVCLPIIYAGNIAGLGVSALIGLITQSNISNLLVEVLSGNDVWANILFIVLLAPVAEELFFRKLLISKLLPFGEKPAIIVSALLFALIHGNFTQLFYAFGLGLAFGYIFVKTGRVRYTIAAHMFINLIGALTLSLTNDIGVVAMIAGGLLVMGLFGMTIAGIVLFFVNVKRIRMNRGIFSLPGGKSAAFLNAGMLLNLAGCAAAFVYSTIRMIR